MLAYNIFIAFTRAYFMFAYRIMSILFAITWVFTMFTCAIFVAFAEAF